MNLIEIVMTNSNATSTQAPNDLLSKANGSAEIGTGRGIYLVATDQPATNWTNTLRSLGLQGMVFAIDATQIDLSHAPGELRAFFTQHFPHVRGVAA